MSSGFRTECPECFAVFRLKDESAVGKRMKCRKCGHAFRIRPADEDDFGQTADDWGTAPAVPRAGARPGPKAKRKSKPFPWKLPLGVAAGLLLVLAVGWGGYKMVTKAVATVAGAGLSTMFDSHESLLDESLDNYQALEEALASIETKDDIPAAAQKIAEIRQRTDGHDERLIALGEIDGKRVRELTNYWNDGKEKRQAAADRVQAQLDRLSAANLMTRDLEFDLAFFRAVEFDFNLVRTLPEPDASRPKERYFHDRTQALRRANRALTKMKDDSSAAAQLEEIQAVTEQLRELTEKAREPEFRRATSNVSSPYFAPHLSATTTLNKLCGRVQKRMTGNAAAVTAVEELDAAVSNLAFADMGVPGSGGRPGPFGGHGRQSGQEEDLGDYPSIAAGDPPDGHKRLAELHRTMAGGDPSAPVVIIRATGESRMPLMSLLMRSFQGRYEGSQPHEADGIQYAVARIRGSLKSIADQIHFGTVTGIDPKARLIAVNLSSPADGGEPGSGGPGSRRPGAGGPGAGGRLPFNGTSEQQRAQFIERAGGPDKVVTITFTNGEFKKVVDFQKTLSAKKVAKGTYGTPKMVLIPWSDSPQKLADRIDFADVVSVDEAERTLEVTLPD